ncbi:MAG: FAD-dependent oxidoreductase [Clostridiales bacterium]|nr:FAD-dependent oxidoreductase [Clostridiales bacterium]
MADIQIIIDGKTCTAPAGGTILDAAQSGGVFIPTLCHDGRTEIYGNCGLCAVEVEGNPKLLKACATAAAEGMVVHTDTERVCASRKTVLELLLSNHVGDCRPPCVQACPAHTDCQGYVGLAALHEPEESYWLIKEKIPIPASIGRICPHPCEDACRRGLMDEPVGIAWIKRFCGDYALANVKKPPACAPDTGKSVGIIGAGPYGLSLAYFLRRLGHAVTLYEAMPNAGGMMRYGIPEYRLPKAVMEAEVRSIEAIGAKIRYNTRIGQDLSFEEVKAAHDAVCIGIGAWVSTGTGAPGEDLPGVVGGIDFLRRVVRGEQERLDGKNVVVVGGGNTAMDACRTALRLGAKSVYNVYRRTKNEMPADAVEIEEGEEEGVIFKNLTNPISYEAVAGGNVARVLLQIMELGEPDASGRRSPVPVEGKTETLDADFVILAIGQAVDARCLSSEADGVCTDNLERTRKNGIVCDPATFRTSAPGVFCGGDCANDKITIAVEAIADAKHSVGVIDAYLRGEDIPYAPPYIVERTDITEKTFEGRERQCRPKMEMLPPDIRKNNFDEVVAGWSLEDAASEGARCLECGCGDYFECRLYEYANAYGVHPERFAGEYGVPKDPLCTNPSDDGHPYIVRDNGKCILCGLCVRVCEEVAGVCALGFTDRGFDAAVKPELGKPLADSSCVACGQCVAACPTGALQERLLLEKSVPLETSHREAVCTFCKVGCKLVLEERAGLLVKVNPARGSKGELGPICVLGKFGFGTEIRAKETGGADALASVKAKAASLDTKDFAEAFRAIGEAYRHSLEQA